ncbi:MAG TPA: DUF2723 domain-containing protein, partial [Candidatus Goldiibacteriota bacterium]|nr:DUF2723 domain-containing protein [Candidatus Goldiibacteriota bacterium]
MKLPDKYFPALAGCLVFLASFYLYIRTLCPSVYFGDSGELIAAAKTLGVPHPTGFPLYLLTAKFFSALPLAAFAFRVNLVSAAFGALACAALFFALHVFSRNESSKARSILLPAAVSLVFMAGYTMWSQASIARI